MVVGLPQLVLQVLVQLPRFVELHDLRVDVLSRQVGDQGSSGSIVQGTQVFLNKLVAGRQTGHHESVRVAAQTLLQQLSQLALAVRDETLVGARLLLR